MKKSTHIIICIFLILIGLSALNFMFSDGYTKKGYCYDNFNNKINGVNCDINVYPVLEDMGCIGKVLTSLLIFIIMILIIFVFLKSMFIILRLDLINCTKGVENE